MKINYLQEIQKGSNKYFGNFQTGEMEIEEILKKTMENEEETIFIC